MRRGSLRTTTPLRLVPAISVGLLVAVLAGLAAGPAAQAPSLLDANQLYQKGEYAGAAAEYRQLLKTQPNNPYLHYNLANASYKQGGAGYLGHAIVEYARAYRDMPRDPDIRHNFDFALKRAGESLIPPSTPQTLYFAFHLLSADELLGLQWIGYWISLLLGTAYILLASQRTMLRPWLIMALALWVFAGSWWGLRRTMDIADPGIVLEANAEARSGPGPNFPVSFNAPEGRRVTILSQDGGWLEIGVLKEGLRGWLPAAAVERI